MKRFMAGAVCAMVLALSVSAEEKPLSSKAYDAAVSAAATVCVFSEKAVEAVKDANIPEKLQKKYNEAKKEWERDGSEEAKKKFEEARAAIEQFGKDVAAAKSERD